MKKALVKPVLKKPSIDSEVLQNYRLISNLQFLSTWIERASVSRITKKMAIYELHRPLQSAYRASSSTETAQVKVQKDISMMTDEKKAVILVLLDLSTAFYINLLLSRMIARLGIAGNVLTWLKLYISGRSQLVSICDAFSLVAT